VPRNRVQSESDFIPVGASPSGFAVIYNFSISPTCGWCRNVFSYGVYSSST